MSVFHRQPIGKKEIIESWTVEDLREFHQQWYYPGNMCLYIVGNVNPDRTAQRIADCFGEEPPKYAVRQVCIVPCEVLHIQRVSSAGKAALLANQVQESRVTKFCAHSMLV